MKRSAGWLAVAGFGMSLLVHVFAYAGVSLPARYPAFWLLQVGIFVVFGPAVAVLTKASRAGRLKDVATAYPAGVFVAAAVLQFYVLTAGLIAMSAIRGSVEESPAGYALVNHGQFIRELTRNEFLQAQAMEARAFSSVWLLFYGISALFWLFGSNPRRQSRRFGELSLFRFDAFTRPLRGIA